MNQEESIVFAGKFLEDILSFYEVNLTVHSSFDDGVIQLSVPHSELDSLLIGKKADTLKSFQHIIVAALVAHGAEIQRVNVDIAGFKKRRAEMIAQRAERWIEEVRNSGEEMTLNLNPSDRRIVHKVAQDYSDIETHSEGEGRARVLKISIKQ